MRTRSNLFQGRLPLELHTKPPVMPESKPILDDYTPAQQFALMVLRRSDLSKAVVAKLYHSTVRAGVSDFDSLVPLRLALRERNGHTLTPRGRFIANQIARELARKYDVTIAPAPIRQRGFYRPGEKARFNFW